MLKSRHEYGLVTVLLLWYVLSGIPTISAQQIAMEAIYGHIQPSASHAAETPKAMHVSHELHRELHHSGPFLRANHAFDSDYNDKCTIGNSSSFYVRDLFNQTVWNTIEATCIEIVDGKFAVWVEAHSLQPMRTTANIHSRVGEGQ